MEDLAGRCGRSWRLEPQIGYSAIGRDVALSVFDEPLPGLLRTRRIRRSDSRGFLERLFDCDDLITVFGPRAVMQVNHTLTNQVGTVRGIHLQLPPRADMKFVQVTRGEAFDVAVDLRYASPTFGNWFGCVLSGENCEGLIIPEGFGHAIQTLAPETEVVYVHSAPYDPSLELSVDALSAVVGVTWPLEPANRSQKDLAATFPLDELKGISW